MTISSRSLVPDRIDQHQGLVWHYTAASGLISILQTHTLWATSTSFLNDAAEVQLGMSLLEDELSARVEAGDPLFTEVHQAVLAGGGVQGPSPSQFFVLSAAGDADLLAMWRSYGGVGESYALGLDPAADLSVLATAGVPDSVTVSQLRWEPVRYRADDHRELVDKVFDGLPMASRWIGAALSRGADRNEVLAGISDLLDDMEQALLLIKHPGFTDERESRHCSIIRTNRQSNYELPVGLVHYRVSAHGIAPYLRLTGASVDLSTVAHTPSLLPIRAVAISPSPNGSAAQASLRGLLSACGYGNVDTIRSSVPFRG